MTAKDLMIGDWVIFNNIPQQVTYINLDDGERIGTTKEYFAQIVECFEPIPLTPEILEKNGFVAQPNIGYIINDYNGISIIYDRWEHKLKIIMEYDIVFNKSYFDDIPVHELQHALKLCGIEKEIVV